LHDKQRQKSAGDGIAFVGRRSARTGLSNRAADKIHTAEADVDADWMPDEKDMALECLRLDCS